MYVYRFRSAFVLIDDGSVSVTKLSQSWLALEYSVEVAVKLRAQQNLSHVNLRFRVTVSRPSHAASAPIPTPHVYLASMTCS